MYVCFPIPVCYYLANVDVRSGSISELLSISNIRRTSKANCI